jgi:hypothetical protein
MRLYIKLCQFPISGISKGYKARKRTSTKPKQRNIIALPPIITQKPITLSRMLTQLVPRSSTNPFRLQLTIRTNSPMIIDNLLFPGWLEVSGCR